MNLKAKCVCRTSSISGLIPSVTYRLETFLGFLDLLLQIT
jgi:hypothetical protein